MKRILFVVLMAAMLATPALAEKVYLKDGGVIQAKRAWRSGGKVHVLATRHTLTSFEKSEVDLKRTFPKKRRVTKKVVAVKASAQTKATTVTSNGTADVQKHARKKAAVSLPNLSKLPEKSSGSLVPPSGAGGAIRQQKKEMAEKLAE